jgi:hypothetical protein
MILYVFCLILIAGELMQSMRGILKNIIGCSLVVIISNKKDFYDWEIFGESSFSISSYPVFPARKAKHDHPPF